MDAEKALHQQCSVNTNTNDDCFVGIRVSNKRTEVHFPIGFNLPEKEDDLRIDICNLLNILSDFVKEEGSQAREL